jgi:hypothetical protein
MATSLPRQLNPDTGEWEVVGNQINLSDQGGYQPGAPTEFGAGSTTQPASGNAPLPPPITTAPAPPNTGTYNPNQDFITGNLHPQETMPTENTTAQPSVVKVDPTTDTTKPTALPADLSYNMTRDDQERWVKQYLSAHGGDPNKSPYWMGKLALGWDIPYFMTKLANDESIPGAQWAIDAAKAPTTTLAPIAPPNLTAAGPTINISAGPADSNLDPAGNWNNGETDPYAELGGGVRLASGLWVPKGSALANGPLWNGGKTNTTTTTTTGNTNTTYQQAIQNLLNTPTKVDPTELMNSSENQAFGLAAQRAEERQRAQIAERNAANGLDASGGQENAFAGLRQSRGEQETQFVGQLAITRMQQQREDIVKGIEFAMADQQFDKAQALKEKLAQLDASLRTKQMELQAAAESAKLTESGRQYNLGLGFSYTELQARQQQAAMDAILRGVSA